MISLKCLTLLNARSNKANLRDLIAATNLVILPKLNSNHRFFHPCHLEIWWMTPKSKRAPLLYCIKLCASFQIHQWFLSGVTVWKWITLENNRAPLLQYVKRCASFKAVDELKLELQPGNAQFDDLSVPCDLEISLMTMENNRAPLLYYSKLCASF